MKELNYCWRCGSKLSTKKYEGRERYYCSKCEEIVYRNSVPVAGVFVVRNREVLLIKRGGQPHKGKWSYPAGYLEYDEKPETGAVRELSEETGLNAPEEKLELVATIHLEHPDKYVVGNAYTVSLDLTEGRLTPGDDALDAKFWTLDEMRENLEEVESEKIIDAAEKAINMILKSNN